MTKELQVALGVLIPFAGTTLGASLVVFMKNEMSSSLRKMLAGFASGVMMAASVWSLLLPAIEKSEEMGKIPWLSAALGFLAGIGFLLLLDSLIPHQHFDQDEPEGLPSHARKNTMLLLAVTIHNIPEGMAVGVVFAAFLTGNSNISLTGAMALAIGIAIQNFPEGAIASMPLKNKKTSKWKAFSLGTLSGAVEPIAAVLTILPAVQFSGMIDPVASLEGPGRWIGEIYPTSHFLTIARGTFSKALDLTDLWQLFIPLAVAIPVVIGLSVLLLKKQEG